jgi:DNA ligase-1
MRFERLAEYWQAIEKTNSRLAITAILAKLFGESEVKEIDKTVYLSLGQLRPKYEGMEFNLAEKMIQRSIAAAVNRPVETIARLYKQSGDLGETVQQLYQFQTPSKLSVSEVYRRLWQLAADSGQGSQERKIQAMADLIKNGDKQSAKYLVRIPVNKLRLGFSEMTVLDGLSWMVKGDKSLRPDLEKAFNVCADIGLIAKEYKNKGIKSIRRIKPQIGVPIRPQKSERLPSAEKIVEKLKEFAVEGKWDGLRVQIHLDKFPISNFQFPKKQELFEDKLQPLVRIFSRNLDNMTKMFPDIVRAAQSLPAASAILDGEAVAYDAKTGKLLGFQETVQRKRIHGVIGKAKELPLKVFIYDLLFLNGQTLINEPFKRRRQALERLMAKPINGLELAGQSIVTSASRLRELREQYIRLGLEGVMCKKLNEPYRAGARNFNWVKFKKVTQGELADTIDAVVLGYYLGKGKRTVFGAGAFLAGIPDADGRYGSLVKVGSGLTEEQCGELVKRCQKIKTREKPEEYLVDKSLYPDVWVRPELVTEIMADEITKSPVHAFGLALRFPRLMRFRDDKKAADATGRDELRRLFKSQRQ